MTASFSDNTEFSALPAVPEGQVVDDGRGRMFPCGQCGADLEFHIGLQSLQCPWCGHVQELNAPPEDAVVEQDFHSMLERLREKRTALKQQLEATDQTAAAAEKQHQQVICASCSGTVEFYGTLTSTECPWCAAPVQLEGVHHASEDRIPVDGMLPFLVDHGKASSNLSAWVQSRWFAPNDFRRRGIEGKFQGIFLPYFTYDAITATAWSGQRGDNYTVTVGTGNDRRTETRISWTFVSGSFQRFFDDVLVLAGKGLRRDLMQALEPWPLHQVVPFNPQLMAGITARTYDIELDECFAEGRQRIAAAIEAEVRQRIGGDHQRISRVNTRYSGITYKHLLLPAWIMTYRWQNKTRHVFVNATTGEVQGERPYSVLKILLAVLVAVSAIGLAVWYFQNQ
jgi:DNA-directed RNA polymerase subunit RPC12/RpoP